MFIRALMGTRFPMVMANLSREKKLLRASRSFKTLFLLAYEPAVESFTKRPEYRACRKVYLQHARDICRQARAPGWDELGETTRALGSMASEVAEERLRVPESVAALTRMPAYSREPRVSTENLQPRVGKVGLSEGEPFRSSSFPRTNKAVNLTSCTLHPLAHCGRWLRNLEFCNASKVP
jgi:hypothetical protein